MLVIKNGMTALKTGRTDQFKNNGEENVSTARTQMYETKFGNTIVWFHTFEKIFH